MSDWGYSFMSHLQDFFFLDSNPKAFLLLVRTWVKEVNYSEYFGFGDAYLTITQSYSYQACLCESAAWAPGRPLEAGAPQA